jgi:hypothetical protein
MADPRPAAREARRARARRDVRPWNISRRTEQDFGGYPLGRRGSIGREWARFGKTLSEPFFWVAAFSGTAVNVTAAGVFATDVWTWRRIVTFCKVLVVDLASRRVQ